MTKTVCLPSPFVIKPYTKKELAALYDLSKYIMNKWLNAMQPELGEPLAGRYDLKQVEMIINRYGIPGQFMYEAA